MNSWPVITISNETNVNIGNTGVLVDMFQTQRWDVTFVGANGAYRPADPEFPISWRHTNVFYVSGTVAEAGGFVTLSSNGSVPAEFDGKALASDAVIVIPEIFLSKYSDAGNQEPEPDPPPPPRAADGRVEDGNNVFFLYHADRNVPEWADSSLYNRTIAEKGLPELDQLRLAFGTGALKCPDNQSIAGNGLVADTPPTEGWLFEDFAFTFEARIRFDKLEGEQILMSYGNNRTLFEIRAKFYQNELMEDKQAIVLEWLPDDQPVDEEDPLSVPPPEIVEIELDTNAWKPGPDVFQQTSFLYEKTTGEFALFVDGVKVAYYDASQRIDPGPWNSIFLPPYIGDDEDPGYDPDVPLRSFAVGCGIIRPGNGFIGRMDEIRWVINEALYDVSRDDAQVYSFAWPNPSAFNPGGLNPDP